MIVIVRAELSMLFQAEICYAYRVGDDQDVGVRGRLGSSLSQVTDDGGVGVEQIVTGHTGLTGDTGGNEDDLSILQAGIEARGIGVVAGDNAVGVDVAQVSGDTWRSELAIARGSGSAAARQR